MKSFEDLHKLYWVCVKEQNRTLTREKERSRLRAGYGDAEGEARVEVVRFLRNLTPLVFPSGAHLSPMMNSHPFTRRYEPIRP